MAVLTSLVDLDSQRLAANNASQRVGNVDVLGDTGIAVCQLNYLMPFSIVRGDGDTRSPWNILSTVDALAASALAAQHLNTGNGSVVPQVSGLNERCNIRFTMESFDTEISQTVAVDQVIAMSDRTSRLPCAIVGAIMSRISMSTAIITGLRGYAQVSPLSSATGLDDKEQYPLFARTLPSADGSAIPEILYIRNVLNVKHLAVLHTTDPGRSSHAIAIQNAANMYAPDLKVLTFDLQNDYNEDIMKRTVGLLKETGFTFFFGVVHQFLFDDLMTEAHRQGIAGTGLHNWIFTGGKDFARRTYERDSALHLSMRGVSMLTPSGYWPNRTIFDNMYSALKDVNNEQDVAYLKTKLPNYPTENASDIFSDIMDDESWIQAPKTRGAVTWVYDAVIALGLAACSQTNNGEYFDGETHFQALLNTTFDGVTGVVAFDPVTGTRQPQSALYKVINIVEDIEKSNETIVGFKEVHTSIFEQGRFSQVKPFIFNDGTSNIPLDLPRVEVEDNYLHTGVRVTGLIMCAIVLVLSLAFSIWTWRNRTSRVIKASQPCFLHIICAGTLIMGASIIPLSFDEGMADTGSCDVACMAFPWLLSIGFTLVFSALWAKTHRINRIFRNPSCQRIKVTAWDVARPMIGVLGANILVLSLWSANSPLEWQTAVTSVDKFDRSIETRGHCTSDHAIGYVIALACVNLGPLVFSIYEAFVARDISTQYSESEYIFKALILILLACFIGIPVAILARENPSAYFFALSAMISVVCGSILLLIFVPKIKHRRREHGRVDRNSRRSTVPFQFSRSGSRMIRRESSSSNQSNRSNGSESASDKTAEGIMVLRHPKNLQTLQEENESLIAENSKLKSMLQALQLHQETSTGSTEPTPAEELSVDSAASREVTATKRVSFVEGV